MSNLGGSISARSEPVGSRAAITRTMLLSLALFVACALLLRFRHLTDVMPSYRPLSWWSMAILAALAQAMVFDVEFRREVYTFTFSEIPLVLGLFLAHPIHLVFGRLIGEALFLVLRERQPPRKMLLNLASFLAETTALLLVYRALHATRDITRPLDWAATLAAVGAADLTGYLIVYRVVRWHGAPIAFRAILGIGALTVPVNTSFALVVGVLIVEKPWATLLLSGVGAFLVLAYRSYTELRQRFESLSLLYDFTRLVSGAQRPDAVLEAMLDQAKDLLRAERAEIWVRDDGSSMLRLRVDDAGRAEVEAPDSVAIRAETWFAVHPDATIIDARSNASDEAELLVELGAKNCIVAPITESGVVVGLVAVANRLGDVNHFADSDRTMFATLANHASVALENGRLIDRLHQQAKVREHEVLHDSLTGLPNRSMFVQKLTTHLDDSSGPTLPIAVAMMDLDSFKEINDTLGHQSGDAVLVEVARRFHHASDDTGLVARLGGDEFALLVVEVVDRVHLEAMGRRIRDEVSRPMTIDGVRVNVTVSIGFALAPEDSTEPGLLLQRADTAMYGAKLGNGNGVAFYDAFRDESSGRRLAIAADLRHALDEGQFSVVYQPQAQLPGGEILGFEALVRWHHPELGQVFPDEFIPIAERSSIIADLTRFVLRTALAEAKRWHDAGHSFSVAVNIAMRNLLDDDFPAVVKHLVAESGCRPDRVILEITESGVMSDATRTIDILRQLDAFGVRLSVDDFGTGYSSLSYLQQLPVEEVKIDKHFVLQMATDPNAEAIVRAVADLARNLGLRLVAEGVENAEVWNKVRDLGCDVAQGYHLSRPMGPDAIDAWLRSWHDRAAFVTGAEPADTPRAAFRTLISDPSVRPSGLQALTVVGETRPRS